MSYVWQLPDYRSRFYAATDPKIHHINEFGRSLCGKIFDGGQYEYPVVLPKCRRCRFMSEILTVKV